MHIYAYIHILRIVMENSPSRNEEVLENDILMYILEYFIFFFYPRLNATQYKESRLEYFIA